MPDDRRAFLHLTVAPGAKRSEIVEDAGGLRVRVAAPPVEGKANRALIDFLAAILQVARSRVTVLRGGGSRHKVIEVQGVSTDEALGRLRAHARQESGRPPELTGGCGRG